MSISKDTRLNNQIIALDNELAKQSHSMEVEYQRMFYIALAHIKNDQKDNCVVIDKKDFFDLLDIHSKDKHTRIRLMWRKLIPMTQYDFGPDDGFVSGVLITKVDARGKTYKVYFEPEFMPLLTQLSPGFTRLLRDDVISFKSKFSSILYQQLMRLNGFGYRGIEFTTRELKQRFGMKDDDYVYDGKFNRKMFEKKSIDLAVKEINELSKCINDLHYEKVKDNRGQVLYYKFFFTYKDPTDMKQKEDLNQTTIYDYIDLTTNEKEDNNDFTDEVKEYEWWKK